ncbi:MAG: DnaJ domain-containing protein [Proteobacteria bacterium]|nr:DnaJ domain-containing protein [Pseudomonadota bacterium]
MTTSLYQILGVSRHDGDAQIKGAYRRLVKQLHPDLHPNDSAVADRFKDISRAYAILSDPDERGRYDRSEIDANGARRRPFTPASGPSTIRTDRDGFEPFFHASKNGSRVFQKIFNGLKSSPNESFNSKRADHCYEISISFFEAARGVSRRLSLNNGKIVALVIPPGTSSGQSLRLRGQGEPAFGSAQAGNALVAVHVTPHEVFSKMGNDVRINLPISADEASRGGKIRVPTLDGAVTMKLPRGSTTGTILRLKGKGIEEIRGRGRGDQHVHIHIVGAKIGNERENQVAE